MNKEEEKVFWNNIANAMTDYNASERHFKSLQLWAIIFFVTAFAFLLIAGSNGWIK